MRPLGIAVAAALSATMLAGFCTSSRARASTDDGALNGTYIATSNGDWAKTRESYHDEATLRSTWTITSTCSDPEDCTGQVSSDQGWSAPIAKHSAQWTLQRDVPNWEPCADGTTFTGHQTYRFWPVNPDGTVHVGSPILAGEDRTIGPSGACGVNQWLVIRMPFRLDEVT
jgi:hypothetical protein